MKGELVMTGIKDIAEKAGVSISTVSYALNGSDKVSEKTRARIISIANELNYIPNMAGRTLKHQQTRIIGVYLADYGGSFYGELLAGIKQGLNMYHYEMIVCSGYRSQLFIPQKLVDGAIILDWTFKNNDIIKFADLGYQMIVLDRELNHPNVRKVLLDNQGGATLALLELIKHHPEKIFLVSGSKKAYDSNERLKAAKRELERYQLKYEVVQGDFTESSGYKAAQSIYTHYDNKPLYIFSLNDEMAVGMYQFFKEKRLTIGKDINLVGFDNIEVSSFLQPRLTTVAYSQHRWGMIAAEKILQLVREEKVEDEKILTTLISGQSVTDFI